MKSRLLFAAMGAALVLAACGGGGDDTPVATAQVPPSASESVGGFTAYLLALMPLTADDIEPVDISSVMPQTDDSSGPQVLE
ncbi:MAG: hypothetical protein ABIV63_12395 [Caldimonas sp.]